MKIDVFSHIIPQKYKEGLHRKMAGAWQLKLMEGYPALRPWRMPPRPGKRSSSPESPTTRWRSWS